MNGKILVESTPNEGSTFSLEVALPVAPNEVTHRITRSKRILIVDHNQTSRQLLEERSSELSFHTECVYSATDACQWLQQFTQKIDAVVINADIDDEDAIISYIGFD